MRQWRRVRAGGDGAGAGRRRGGGGAVVWGDGGVGHYNGFGKRTDTAVQQLAAIGVDWENGRIARSAGWQSERSCQVQLLYPFPF